MDDRGQVVEGIGEAVGDRGQAVKGDGKTVGY